MSDTNAPERIWATAYYSQNRSEHVREWSTRGFEDRQDVEYIRADLATPAPREDGYSAGVRAAAAVAYEKAHNTNDISKIRDAILALLDAPAPPDARAGAVEPVGWFGFDPNTGEYTAEWCSVKPHDAEGFRPLYAGPPTPACTATDGPASASVYRAPGPGTAADWERG